MNTANPLADADDQAAEPAVLAAFFSRLEAFCEATRREQPRVGRLLFGASNRLEQIRAGSDIGVRRLARAEADLTRLASEAGITLPSPVENAESGACTDRPAKRVPA